MAYTIDITKRTNGGYTIVTEDYTCYPSEVSYHGTSDGIILFGQGLRLLRFYRPSEWTIQTVTGYTTVVQVADALDALGVLSSDTLEDIEALLTTIDADTGAIVTAVQLMDDDLDDARIALQVIDDWDESDRAKVNIIASQAGVDGNSGNKSDKTVRVVLATDQPQNTNSLKVVEDSGSSIKTAVEIMDDWDESDRAKVNLIASQAGVDGNSGNKSDKTVRVVIATDQPALTNKLLVTEDNSSSIKSAVEIMDDWDESDRAKVNLIASQAGVDGNSGNKSDKTVRVVIATDQPALTNKLLVTEDNSGSIKTAVELLDNAVDGNYLNANINIAGTDCDAGSGNIGTATQRVVIATDDVNTAKMVTALEIMDDWDDSNYCNVNLNVAGTDVAANSGTLNAQTLRVAIATDDVNTVKIVNATELLDDTVATLGTTTYSEATTKGLVVGAVRTDAETVLANTTNEISPLSLSSVGRLKVESQGRTTAPVVLVAAGSAQNVTDGWVDHGAEITTSGAHLLDLWTVVTHTNSVNVRVRILGKHTATTGAEFVIPIKTVSTTDIRVNAHYYELDSDATQNILLDWDVSGIPYVQVQISCETVGVTADTVSSDYTLMF